MKNETEMKVKINPEFNGKSGLVGFISWDRVQRCLHDSGDLHDNETVDGYVVTKTGLKFFINKNLDKEHINGAMIDYTIKSKDMNDIIKAYLGKDPDVVYAAYPIDADNLPIDNLKDIAVQGDMILYQSAEEMYGELYGQHFQTEILHNPTWLDIAIQADHMMNTVLDFQNDVLEGVVEAQYKIDGVKVFYFVMTCS